MTPDEAHLEGKLVRAQAASGALLALFLFVHLLNLGLAALGPATYDGFQQAARRAYQWPPVELLLVLGPLLVHVTTAVWRMLRRRQQGRRPPANLAARLHRASGVVLLIFAFGHVAATRGASLLYGVWPGFQGVAFTFRWVPAYFWPYYTAFALAGLYHLIYGLGTALPVLGLHAGALRRPAVLGPLAGLGGLALVLGLLRLGGVTGPVEHPEESGYAKLILRLTSRWSYGRAPA